MGHGGAVVNFGLEPRPQLSDHGLRAAAEAGKVRVADGGGLHQQDQPRHLAPERHERLHAHLPPNVFEGKAEGRDVCIQYWLAKQAVVVKTLTASKYKVGTATFHG